MDNGAWTAAAVVVFSDTNTALQTLWDNINKGQQKQLVKIPEVKTILDRYGVEYD